MIQSDQNSEAGRCCEIPGYCDEARPVRLAPIQGVPSKGREKEGKRKGGDNGHGHEPPSQSERRIAIHGSPHSQTIWLKLRMTHCGSWEPELKCPSGTTNPYPAVP